MAMDHCVRFLLVGISETAEFQHLECFMRELEGLPTFSKRVVSIPADEWDEWLAAKIKKERWEHQNYSGKLLVVREPAFRGGDALFVGGAKELREYAKRYYEMTPQCPWSAAEILAAEEVESQARIAELKKDFAAKQVQPTVVCVTAGTEDWAIGVVTNLISDGILPADKQLSIKLLVGGSAELADARAVAADIEDCALRRLHGVDATASMDDAFTTADYVIVLDKEGRRGGDEADDEGGKGDQAKEPPSKMELLRGYAEKMRRYADCICAVGKPGVRVIVAGPHCNLAAAVMRRGFDANPAPAAASDDGMRRQVMTSSSLCERYGKTLISKAVGTRPASVRNVVAWGKLSQPCLVSASSLTTVQGHGGAIFGGPANFTRPLAEVLFKPGFVKRELQQKVREHSPHAYNSAIAVSKAVADTLQPFLWLPATVPAAAAAEKVTTVGLPSQGQYGVPQGMVFGFPASFDVELQAWTVVEDLPLEAEDRAVIAKGVKRMEEYLKKFELEFQPVPQPVPQDTREDESK